METSIHSRTLTKKVTGESVGCSWYKRRLDFVAHAKLSQYKGQEPSFSICADLYPPGGLKRGTDIIAGGQMCDEMRKHFPALRPFLPLHLSSENGEPMHAEANAAHWAGIGQYGERNLAYLSGHLRITLSEAEELKTTGDIEHKIDALRPFWKEQAEQFKVWLQA